MTHQVNIAALTDVVPSAGETVVAALDDDGRLSVKFRFTTTD